MFGPFPLGFTFNYYGLDVDEIRISTNGFLTFQTTVASAWVNRPIPSTHQPDALIAPLWDDHNPEAAGTIYYLADTENQRFIVQYDDVAHFSDPEQRQTFQVILGANGTILFQYRQLSDTSSCTVGIENLDGTDGLEVLYNSGGYLEDGLAIRIDTGGPAWLDYSRGVQVLLGGESLTTPLTFSAAGLVPGQHAGNLLVISDAPVNGQVTVPVVLTVDATTAVDLPPPLFALHGAAPNPFNPATTIRYSLASAGRAELRLYDLRGRLVQTLIDGHRPAGPGEVRWDGRDQSGRRVASGTYFARLRAGGQTEVRSVMLVK